MKDRNLPEHLTAEDIRLTYRLLLGREPENETVVRNWMGRDSLDELLRAFLDSSEFRRRHPNLAASGPAALVAEDAPPIAVEWQVEAPVAERLLAHVRAVWTRLGEERPHWSARPASQFEPERITGTAPEFFASGAGICAALLAGLRRHGLDPARFPRLFEFGCGVARVTPHFAGVFRSVTGCDISAGHLEIARRVVAASGIANVSFSLVQSTEFGMTAPFDLWFSRFVLQHNPPPLIAMILRRALSLLAPGGVAAFQLPTHAVGYRFDTESYLRTIRDGGMEMHVLPQPVVFGIAAECSCEPLEVWQDQSAGPPGLCTSSVFLLRKAAPATWNAASAGAGYQISLNTPRV